MIHIDNVTGTVEAKDLNTTNGCGTGSNGIEILTSSIRLSRETSGTFDNALYDATSFNRGWLTIQYVP